MSSAGPFLPWFAPKLSRAMRGVLSNIGHKAVFSRGERIYESPGFFHKLMLVERGIVAKALMDPFHADPLLLALSGPGALCGSYETLYLQDRMERSHWCMTSTSVIIVNADLLLRICDQNPVWQRELTHYCSVSAISDRLGLLVVHSASAEERLGMVLIASSAVVCEDFLERLLNPNVQWVVMEALPSMRVVTSALSMTPAEVRGVLHAWAAEDVIRRRPHKVLLSRRRFVQYWSRMEPILSTAGAKGAESARRSVMPVRDCPFPDPMF